jgi:hypothetical protein
MDKLRSFAKIALAAIGIFFAFRLFDNMIMLVNTIIFGGLRGSKFLPGMVFASVVSLMFLGLCLAAICYVCFYKREQLAERIVGTDEPADPRSQIDWLYTAFRLVCIAAGLYCLHSVIWRFVYAIQRHIVSRAQNYDVVSRVFRMELVLGWLVMLAIGTYLICGAPHFVRWHVRKTLEQCRLDSADVDNSK